MQNHAPTNLRVAAWGRFRTFRSIRRPQGGSNPCYALRSDSVVTYWSLDQGVVDRQRRTIRLLARPERFELPTTQITGLRSRFKQSRNVCFGSFPDIHERLLSAKSGHSDKRVFWELPADHLMRDQGVAPSAFCDQRRNRTPDTRIFSQSENKTKKTHRD